jgi:hypothetical protein
LWEVRLLHRVQVLGGDIAIAAHGSGTRPLSGFGCASLVFFDWPFVRGHQHAGASMADPQTGLVLMVLQALVFM